MPTAARRLKPPSHRPDNDVRDQHDRGADHQQPALAVFGAEREAHAEDRQQDRRNHRQPECRFADAAQILLLRNYILTQLG
jgi:hypothetical protein